MESIREGWTCVHQWGALMGAEYWNNAHALEVRPRETLTQRIRRLTRKYPDYDKTKDPFTPFYQTFTKENHTVHNQLTAAGQWLQDHGTRFEVFPACMSMSCFWLKWWGQPPLINEQQDKGFPMRRLQFPSGRQLWQITNPVHGYDEPGATLPDLNTKPNKET